jgi:ATP-dependent Clp protease ATP-binding subunit ClpB
MKLDKLTIKSQEALQAAQQLAVEYGHAEMAVEHLLLALLPTEGLVPRLLQALGATPADLQKLLDKHLQGLPRVSGPGAEAGQVYANRGLQQLFVQDEKLIWTSDSIALTTVGNDTSKAK